MKRSLLEILVCPACYGQLHSEPEAEEVLEGYLHCPSCRHSYPVRDGIPRFVENRASGFEYQWKFYRELNTELYERQFFDWLAPVKPEFFRGKLVLEAGCGKGRHTVVAGRHGARLVVALDVTEAVDVARANAGEASNLAFVQADLMHPPFRPGTFDYAFSIGVLHHLPDPRAAFDSLSRQVKPGGHVSAWVYGRENNGWILYFLDPLRINIFRRVPAPMLHGLAWLGAVTVKLVARGLYAPLLKLWPGAPLFYREYLMYVGGFPLIELETIVFDHLHPTYSHYLRKDEFSAWFQGFQEVVIGWHNRNSWRGFARKPVSTPL